MEKSAILQAEDIARITSLDDLLTFFAVDTDQWEVRDYRINKWEQASGNEEKGITITPLYQVRANLIRRVLSPVVLEEVAEALERLAERGVTIPTVPERDTLFDGPDPRESVLLEVAIMDPHIGMLAWGKETGDVDYDLGIAVREYQNAVRYLLSLNALYNVDRILYVLGNDMLHVDGVQQKVGTTTAGTPQDFDSRLPKIFSAACEAAVAGISMAAGIAPVDVVVVPGNHDEHSMYKLGEVVRAWFRDSKMVRVDNTPRLRKYYTYGGNLIGLTHGLEFARKRESLPLIMADEAPAEWAAATYREIHVGHRHSTAEREHMSPVSNVQETRGVRVRVLPALTATDAWHAANGYRHHRSATALAFRQTGGMVGLHEYTP